jgi:hypothetical protein
MRVAAPPSLVVHLADARHAHPRTILEELL